jgi:calcineurin-like phosphoesterase family protein
MGARPGPDGVTDRLQDQIGLWKRVHQSAREHGSKDIFVLGDLFDKSLVDAITLTATVRAIAEADDLTHWILPGNHDAVNTRGGRFTVEAFGEMGNDRIKYLRTGERYGFGKDGWCGFWPLEYGDQDRSRAALEGIQSKLKLRSVENLLLHHSIVGCKFADWVCDDGLEAEEVCKGFDHVFSGHFHDTQTFGPGKRGMYLGAPMHHRFEDAGRPAGFWNMTWGGEGGCEKEFVDGGCPRFFETEGTLEDAPEGAELGDYIRLNVTATTAGWEDAKADVRARVEAWNKVGYRASFKHKPVYHHARRIVSVDEAKKSGGMTVEAMMSAYVESPDVDTAGLDLVRLRRIGREALEAAKAKT